MKNGDTIELVKQIKQISKVWIKYVRLRFDTYIDTSRIKNRLNTVVSNILVLVIDHLMDCFICFINLKLQLLLLPLEFNIILLW